MPAATRSSSRARASVAPAGHHPVASKPRRRRQQGAIDLASASPGSQQGAPLAPLTQVAAKTADNGPGGNPAAGRMADQGPRQSRLAERGGTLGVLAAERFDLNAAHAARPFSRAGVPANSADESVSTANDENELATIRVRTMYG